MPNSRDIGKGQQISAAWLNEQKHANEAFKKMKVVNGSFKMVGGIPLITCNPSNSQVGFIALIEDGDQARAKFSWRAMDGLKPLTTAQANGGAWEYPDYSNNDRQGDLDDPATMAVEITGFRFVPDNVHVIMYPPGKYPYYWFEYADQNIIAKHTGSQDGVRVMMGFDATSNTGQQIVTTNTPFDYFVSQNKSFHARRLMRRHPGWRNDGTIDYTNDYYHITGVQCS